MPNPRRAAIAFVVASAVAGCTNKPPPAARPTPVAPIDKPAGQAPSTEVELRVVKLPQWREAMDDLKGKVVVVDVWATFCGPCVKKFPQFVALHEKYAKDGLACVSLTVDPTDDQAQALEFLKKRKATFPNYLIDEPTDVWQTQIGIGNPPQAVIFDRDGKLVGKFPNDAGQEYSFEDIEKVFLPLLKR